MEFNSGFKGLMLKDPVYLSERERERERERESSCLFQWPLKIASHQGGRTKFMCCVMFLEVPSNTCLYFSGHSKSPRTRAAELNLCVALCFWKYRQTPVYISHQPQYSNYCPFPIGVDSACNRNECQEYFLGVKAASA